MSVPKQPALIFLVSLGAAAGGVSCSGSQRPAPAPPAASAAGTPRILGIAHMALFVSDLGKARAFYEGFLGFDEPFALKRDDGSDRIAFVKVNDQQYIELFDE